MIESLNKFFRKSISNLKTPPTQEELDSAQDLAEFESKFQKGVANNKTAINNNLRATLNLPQTPSEKHTDSSENK